VSEGGEAVSVSAVSGAPPLGLIFGAIGSLAAVAVGLLHVDRVPLTFCVVKGLSGLPCPTCGSTRVFGRLFELDIAGALAMNPFMALVVVLVAGWAVADVVMNWLYLLAVGR